MMKLFKKLNVPSEVLTRTYTIYYICYALIVYTNNTRVYYKLINVVDLPRLVGLPL